MKPGKILHELARGLRMARTGGVAAGVGFVREEVLRNTWLRASASLPRRAGSGVECNLCGWSGRRFLSHYAFGYLDRNAFCPRCHSYPRHRGFAHLWRERLAGELAYLAARDGRKVMFAPEKGMLDLLQPVVGPMVGADLDTTRALVELREDLQALSFEDGSVDFISNFHVLEHVPDDRRALSELRRVLSPEGRMLLCVPISYEHAETIEFGGPNPKLNDHCFDYGRDFSDRLTEAGLAFEEHHLDEAVPAELHGRLAMRRETIFVVRRG